MCMEDIRIGREKITKITTRTLPDATSTPLFGESRDRVHVTVSAIVGDAVVGFGDCAVELAFGISIPVGHPVYDADIETHGNSVTFPWNGSGVGGQSKVTVIEVFLKKQ